MKFRKFIATPFSDFNMNVYLADTFTEIFECVKGCADEQVYDTVLAFAHSNHDYVCQYIDVYLDEMSDQEWVKMCNQISVFLIRTTATYIDIFESICYHNDTYFTISALPTGIMINYEIRE